MDKKKYFIIVLNAAFVLFMVKIDAFVVNVSLPTIARSFHLDLAEVSGVIVIYLLLLTSTMLIFGKLEDRFGVKKMFLSGYILFTLGSLFCGFSSDINTLVLSRALQGIGGAMLLICGYGSVSKFLPKESEGWGMGIVTTAAALGIATGAPLGGFITHFFSWRWIFFVNVPLGILGFLTSMKYSPEEKISEEEEKKPFDFAGALISFIFLSCVTYVLSTGYASGWATLPTIMMILTAIIFLALFIFWESRFAYPLMDLGIFRNKGFVHGNIAVFLIFMVLAGSDFIIPFHLELSKGFNPLQVGIFMFVYSAVLSLLSPLAGRVLDDPGKRFLSNAFTFCAAALFFIYAWLLPSAGVIIILIFFILWAVSNTFPVNENFRLVMVNTPEDKKGVGSGIFNAANNLSMVFGVCAFQIIFSVFAGTADVPDPSGMAFSGISIETLSKAFSSIFIFGGILYLMTIIFSLLAERTSIDKNP